MVAVRGTWCVAVGAPAVPASPVTLALFLAENPAGATTQRRRVAVVNRVHSDAGYRAPGTATAIRLQLDRTRSDRAAELRQRVAPIIATLPLMGWPTGMFGRRDAVILALSAGGLRAAHIARLERRHIVVTGERVCVGGCHQLDLEPTGGGYALIEFAAVWRRWEQVLQMVDRSPSTRTLEHHFRSGTLQGQDYDGGGSGPVVVPIDRWGAVPLPVVSMTSVAVTAVLATHLAG